MTAVLQGRRRDAGVPDAGGRCARRRRRRPRGRGGRARRASAAGPASGKTTLLTMLGGLDTPDQRDASRLDGVDLAAARRRRVADVLGVRIASVFQSFGLIRVLSAAENVEVPLRIRAVPARSGSERVAAALAAVGLSRSRRPAPGRAVGRPAAARRARACPRRHARHPARRRADRSARQRDGRHDHEPDRRVRARARAWPRSSRPTIRRLSRADRVSSCTTASSSADRPKVPRPGGRRGPPADSSLPAAADDRSLAGRPASLPIAVVQRERAGRSDSQHVGGAVSAEVLGGEDLAPSRRPAGSDDRGRIDPAARSDSP